MIGAFEKHTLHTSSYSLLQCPRRVSTIHLAVNKKAANLYSNALNIAGDGDYREAIKMLENAVKLEPKFLDAYLSIGGIYGEMKDYKNAVLNYEKAKSY